MVVSTESNDLSLVSSTGCVGRTVICSPLLWHVTHPSLKQLMLQCTHVVEILPGPFECSFLFFIQTRCWSQQYVFEAQFLTQWVPIISLLCLTSTWSIGGDTIRCFLSYRELACKYIQDFTKITCAVCCSIKINAFSTLALLRIVNCWVNVG